jgi:hypothetical protein
MVWPRSTPRKRVRGRKKRMPDKLEILFFSSHYGKLASKSTIIHVISGADNEYGPHECRNSSRRYQKVRRGWNKHMPDRLKKFACQLLFQRNSIEINFNIRNFRRRSRKIACRDAAVATYDAETRVATKKRMQCELKCSELV